jgi:hypothetical protein
MLPIVVNDVPRALVHALAERLPQEGGPQVEVFELGHMEPLEAQACACGIAVQPHAAVFHPVERLAAYQRGPFRKRHVEVKLHAMLGPASVREEVFHDSESPWRMMRVAEAAGIKPE